MDKDALLSENEEETPISITPPNDSLATYLNKSHIFNFKNKDKDLIITEKKTILSKSCTIKHPSNILVAAAVISAKSILRADLSTIKIDLYSIICDNVIIKPPLTNHFEYTSLTIGKYSIIGSGTVIKASIIGNCVRIGKNCILEDNVVVGNNSIILDNSILAEDSMVPNDCVFGGRPARFLYRSPVTTKQDHIIEAINYYQSVFDKISK